MTVVIAAVFLGCGPAAPLHELVALARRHAALSAVPGGAE